MLPSCPTPSIPLARTPMTPRRIQRARLWSLALGVLLAGCQATMPPRWEPSPPLSADIATPPTVIEALSPADRPPVPETPSVTDPLQRVLAQTDRIVAMAPSDLAKEIGRLSAIEEDAADTPLLLAIALSHTRQAVDTARALGLVQRVLAKSASKDAQALYPLARLIEARLLQQRRLEDQLDRQTQQLREAQRRNDQLNERLEAVRAIERSLTTRPAVPSSVPTLPDGSNTQRPAP